MQSNAKAETIFSQKKTLKKIASQDRLIFSCQTIFPFTLFPNTVEIRELSITIIYRYFFTSKKIISININDLISVDVVSAVIFGGIIFEPPDFKGGKESIHFLKLTDAKKAGQLVTGLMIALRENRDISKIPTPELEKAILRIGETKID